LAAVLLNAVFLEWTRLTAKLLLSERNCETNSASRNLTFGKVFDGPESDKIAEAVKPFTPTSARANKSQAFPVAKTARLNPQNAPCFSARITLRQAGVLLRPQNPVE
jgi:hypothetical protein